MTGYIKYVQLLFLLVVSMTAVAGKDRYIIEAEAFQFKGKWAVERSGECLGTAMLRLNGGGTLDAGYDALTAFDVQEAGEYHVWVRSADYAQKPGTRLFRLSVDEQPMEVSGRHGHVGFYWEKAGQVTLAKKRVLLRLHDEKNNFGRCDAILFIKDGSVNPNGMDRKELGTWRRNPAKLATESVGMAAVAAPVEIPVNAPSLVSVENGEVRLSFVLAGTDVIACRTEIFAGGVWRRFLNNTEDHKIYLVTSSDSPIDNTKFYPSWKNAVAKRTFIHDGISYQVQSDEDYLNPFVAGELSEAIPVSVAAKGEKSIEVQYVTRNGSVMTGLWTLPEKGTHMHLSLSCTPADSGMYSMAVSAFQSVAPSSLANVLMPPMFQYKRFPDNQTMLLSSMMQQPLAITETSSVHGGSMSSFISGDTGTFGGDWGSSDFSPMGFTLRNCANGIQPVAFSPVMGMRDSRVGAGEIFTRNFVIGILPAGWNAALEYISDNIYQVRDYRRQEDVSLTDAMFNIFDLMRDTEHGGWDEQLKGFYDIEGDPGTAPTVVHSAPLAIVAASVLADDEEFYISRALPTIEYMLSRSGYRWAADIVPNGYNKTMETLKLNPFKSQFNTSCYEGLNALTGGLNPWLEELALPEGRLRQTKGYSVPVYSWVEDISAWRMTGDARWLESAKSTADRFINLHLYKDTMGTTGQMAFYNANVYPLWWNLIDLYEITEDRKYLDAACYGAAHTIAGIRSFPTVSEGMQTLHPGGKYDGNTTMWWKGREKFRLGFPRVDGDAPEHEVEAWKVSPVGLGFEQPGTYFLRAKGKRVRPVFMSSWAPGLLRLYRHTDTPIYQTYARNAVIGRFANYPGYYATGYTDITMSEDFPYRGPDVSSIYYHHIPPHLAFTWDYLVTEATQRSGGLVDFPYALQEGFVWFSNRIYGGMPGTVFSDKNVRLWMRRGLVSVDMPQVNYLTAISDKWFWVLLSSESDREETVALSVEDVYPLLARGNALEYTENGRSSGMGKVQKTMSVNVPAKGFRAVALPLAKTEKPATVEPLEHGMEILDMGEPFGKVFLFRMRSPFGWDSVYGFAETAPRKGEDLAVEVKCGGKTVRVQKYPFEWSFLKFSADEDVTVEMAFISEDMEKIEKVTLKTR